MGTVGGMKRAIALTVLAIALIASTAAATTAAQKQSRDAAEGSAVIQHVTIRGEGDTEISGQRLAPGVWRVSAAVGTDSRLATVTVADADGMACAQTPPPVVMMLISVAAGGECRGGRMTITVALQ